MSLVVRQRLALATLVVACLALVATSPGPPIARQSVEGDVAVSPDAPGDVEVRFAIDSGPSSDEIERIDVTFLLPNRGAPPYPVGAQVQVSSGGYSASGSSGTLSVPPATCSSGCVIDARAALYWIAPPELGIRLRWQAELEVEYSSSVPSSAVSAEIVTGSAPLIPRSAWLAIGGLLALPTVPLWVRAGKRWRGLRLSIAGAAGIPILLMLAASLSGHRSSDYSWVLLLILALGLAMTLIAGIASLNRGNPLVLPVFGWLYLLCIGFASWFVVERLPTYRPHEMVVLGLLLLLPSAAAITSGSLVKEPMRLAAGILTAAVYASQVVQAGLATMIAAWGVFAAVLALLQRPDPLLAAALIPAALVWLYVAGLRDWSRGFRVKLGIANGVALVAAVSLALFVLAQGEGSLFSFNDSARVIAVLLVVVVAVGLLGLDRVTAPRRIVAVESAPPDPEPDRNTESG